MCHFVTWLSPSPPGLALLFIYKQATGALHTRTHTNIPKRLPSLTSRAAIHAVTHARKQLKSQNGIYTKDPKNHLSLPPIPYHLDPAVLQLELDMPAQPASLETGAHEKETEGRYIWSPVPQVEVCSSGWLPWNVSAPCEICLVRNVWSRMGLGWIIYKTEVTKQMRCPRNGDQNVRRRSKMLTRLSRPRGSNLLGAAPPSPQMQCVGVSRLVHPSRSVAKAPLPWIGFR